MSRSTPSLVDPALESRLHENAVDVSTHQHLCKLCIQTHPLHVIPSRVSDVNSRSRLKQSVKLIIVSALERKKTNVILVT